MARVALLALLLLRVAGHDGLPLSPDSMAGSGGPASLPGAAGHHRQDAAAPAAWQAGLPTLDAGAGALDALQPPEAATMEAVICHPPWPSGEALAVAWCESRYDHSAVGRYGERGLFQVLPQLWGPVPSDAAGQVAQAYAIWRQHGWQPWTCQP